MSDSIDDLYVYVMMLFKLPAKVYRVCLEDTNAKLLPAGSFRTTTAWGKETTGFTKGLFRPHTPLVRYGTTPYLGRGYLPNSSYRREYLNPPRPPQKQLLQT
jgi:hypothetical protein